MFGTGKRRKAEIEAIRQRAYEAFDGGQLEDAARSFAEVIAAWPKHRDTHYMLGLACKYLGRWQESLHHNLRALELGDDDEAARWNAGIAATALGDWAEARRQWKACGMKLGEGEGPIEGRFGMVSVRLNPSTAGETVYAQRVCPVRSIVRNIPLPESGFRFGDLVLHDGAATGQRRYGEATVPVFNVLQRLRQSEARTWTAFVEAPDAADSQALIDMTGPAVEYLEDWTSSVHHLCLRCSYGVPHEHEGDADGNHGHEGDDTDPAVWGTERSIGIAAHQRVAAERLLESWVRAGKGRRVQQLVEARQEIPAPRHDHVWWRDPDAPDDD